MSNLVLYHKNCADGLGAAYAAFKKFGENAEYFPINYGNEPPDVIEKNVFILDFSFPKEKLIEMKQSAKSIIVLDHHKTAEENLKDLDFAFFDMNKSGAVLAWEYFHNTEIPLFIKLIQDRDLWKFDFEETKFFNDGLRAYVRFDIREFAKLENEDFVKELIEKGKHIRFIFEKDVLDFSKHKVDVNFNGHIGYGCNVSPKFSSEIGNLLALESKTFGCSFSYSGITKKWHYQLRSVGNYDVSEIAKYFGGGGHKNASGFESETLIGLS